MRFSNKTRFIGANNATRIAGGTLVTTEISFQVRYETPNFLCGGIILNDHVVITAAHCVPDSPESGTVIAGDLKISTTSPNEQVSENYKFYILHSKTFPIF